MVARARKNDGTKKATRTQRKRPASAKARAYHHGDLRSALLRAARDELHEVGWRALSLRSVARRAGVTHTAAYHHFKDKGALLAEIAVEGFRLLDQRMAEAMGAAGDDPLDRVTASAHGYLRMAVEDPAAYDLMFTGSDVDVSEELARVGAAPFHRLVAAVEEARAAAGMKDAHLLDDAMLHWEVVHGLAMLYRARRLERLGLDIEEHTRFVTERLRALYGRPPRSR